MVLEGEGELVDVGPQSFFLMAASREDNNHIVDDGRYMVQVA